VLSEKVAQGLPRAQWGSLNSYFFKTALEVCGQEVVEEGERLGPFVEV
jgi:hypothetical protein